MEVKFFRNNKSSISLIVALVFCMATAHVCTHGPCEDDNASMHFHMSSNIENIAAVALDSPCDCNDGHKSANAHLCSCMSHYPFHTGGNSILAGPMEATEHAFSFLESSAQGFIFLPERPPRVS